jgi:SAM-dependent methyltransferase
MIAVESVATTVTPVCPCCGSDHWKSHAYTDTITYLECVECHYWVQRRPGVADLSAQFETEQLKFYDEDSLLLSPTLSTLTREITDRRISTVLHHLPTGGSIIEAGPGSGDVILSLAKRGYVASAVEHSPVLAKRLREQSGITVLVGDFADQQLPDATYDAYCSFHVIEHVTDFRKHLDVARRCVRIGGLAFIATPNSRGWEQRLPFRLSPNNDSSHFQLFSPRALTLVLEQAGWETVATYTPSYAIAWLRVITKILRRVRGIDEDSTGGQFAKSASSRLRVGVSLFAALTRPFRAFQERLRSGNELFLVAKRVR